MLEDNNPIRQTVSQERKIAELAIYAPMVYTAPYIMFLMRADPLRGQVGGGWALEIETFFGPREIASNRLASTIWGPKKLQCGKKTLPHCSTIFLPHCSPQPPPLSRAANFNHKTY